MGASDDLEWAQDIPKKTLPMGLNGPIGFRGRSFRLFRMGPRHSQKDAPDEYECAHRISRPILPTVSNGPKTFPGESFQ